MKRRLFLITLIVFFLSSSFLSCSLSFAHGEHLFSSDSFSVVNWNVQTFFDAKKDGLEYNEFKQSDWTVSKYNDRLERLCSVIKELNADIYVFEEIENEGIFYDISNFLAGSNWNLNESWNYFCFEKPDDSAIGIGILSKFPLSNLKAHDIDIRIDGNEKPKMRYLLEVTVGIRENNVEFFVNHWKSKSSGYDESRIWRQYQENLLCQKLIEYSTENQNCPVIICGDFNMDIDEFCTEENFVKLCSGNFCETHDIKVQSPWLNLDGSLSTNTGSYYFDENWERIDNFFIMGNIRFVDFRVCSEDPFLDKNGKPFGYKIYSGEGYSDHLPLYGVFSLDN